MTDQRREPITSKTLHVSFNDLLKSAEGAYITLDGPTPQCLLRPLYQAIREAQRLVNIDIEKAALTEQERRLSNIEGAIEERRQKIAQLENNPTT